MQSPEFSFLVMDKDSLIKAVTERTLPNEEALAELSARKNQHAASDPSDPLFDPIREILEDATFVADSAVAANQPAVNVLRDVYLAIGRLKLQAKKAEKERIAPGAQENQENQEQLSVVTPLGSDTRSDLQPGNHQTGEKGEQESQPAEGRHETGSSPPKRNRSRAVLKPENESNRFFATPNFASTGRLFSISPLCLIGAAQMSPSEWAQHSMIPQPRVQLPSSQTSLGEPSLGEPSLSEQNSIQPPSLQLSSSQQPSNQASSSHPPPTTSLPATKYTIQRKPQKTLQVSDRQLRRPRKTPLSKEVIFDSEDSDIQLIMPTKSQKPTVKPTVKPAMKASRESKKPKVPKGLNYIDLSEGLSGFEYLDLDGEPVKRPHGRQVLVKGEVKDALVVKLKVSQDKMLDLESRKRKVVPELVGQAKRAATSKNEVAGQQTGDGDMDSEEILMSPAFFNDKGRKKSTPKPKSRNEPQTFGPVRAKANLPVFPPFPPWLTASQLPNWIKGLVIAIENIIEDHNERPTATILEIIQDLEGDPPTFSADDPRRIILSGSEYVYAAVHSLLSEQQDSKDDDATKDAATTTNPLDPDGDTLMTTPAPTLTPAPTPKKPYYKGKGRAWKKNENDTDKDFRVQSKQEKVAAQLPERRSSRRKVKNVTKDTWKEPEELFADFCAHVKREYHYMVGMLGTVPGGEGVPEWLLE